MQYSIIQKSRLERTHRLDAEYYQPEYLDLIESIKDQEFGKLEDFGCKVVSGPFGSSLKSDAYLEQGIPFIRINDLKDFFINDEDLVYISKDDNNRLKQSQLQPFDLVLSKVGNTIGIVSAISEELGISNISENNIGIKFKESKLDIEHKLFLLTFLNSKLGYQQIKRSISGNAQPKLNISDIYQLLVPKPRESLLKIIKELITQAKFNIDGSNKIYLQAENLLLEELGLRDFEVEDDLSFVVNLSDVKSANRSDSDFFQPKYDDIIKKLKTNQLASLETSFDIIKSKSFEYNQEAEVGVIKTKQLGKQFMNFEVEDKVRQELVQKEKLPLLTESDVVFASMGVGSLGKTNIYYKFESDGRYTIDSTLRIFRKKSNGKISPEVLAIYLSSWVIQELIYKYIVGTSGIISIYENYLQSFLIPVLPKSTQQKISELVRKSHEARKKSKQLLEEAKRKVEEMIDSASSPTK